MPTATPTDVIERLITPAESESTIGCRQCIDRRGEACFLESPSQRCIAPWSPMGPVRVRRAEVECLSETIPRNCWRPKFHRRRFISGPPAPGQDIASHQQSLPAATTATTGAARPRAVLEASSPHGRMATSRAAEAICHLRFRSGV
jgi:hypothetical protein